MFFDPILALTIDGYFEWCTAGYLNVRFPVSTNLGDMIGNGTTYVCLLVCLVVIPAFFLKIMCKPLSLYNSKELTDKYGFFWEDVRTDHRLYALYFMFFTIRRLVFLGIAFFLNILPSMQLLFVSYLNLAFLIYAGTKPLTERYLNRRELF